MIHQFKSAAESKFLGRVNRSITTNRAPSCRASFRGFKVPDAVAAVLHT